MSRSALYEQFTQAATRVGAHVVRCLSASDASAYIQSHAGGSILLPDFPAFITGPSHTADIERVLIIGVHGPGGVERVK